LHTGPGPILSGSGGGRSCLFSAKKQGVYPDSFKKNADFF
jgi:hypothetical protein